MWSLGVIWPDTLLPRSVEAVVTAQYAPHTAETDANPIVNPQMMPNDLSTALQSSTQVQDMFDENGGDSRGRSERTRGFGRNIPRTTG